MIIIYSLCLNQTLYIRDNAFATDETFIPELMKMMPQNVVEINIYIYAEHFTQICQSD